MEIQVVTLENLYVVGFAWSGPYANSSEIPLLFSQFEQRLAEIEAPVTTEWIYAPFHSRETEFTYYVTLAVDELRTRPSGMTGFQIPGKSYAKATHQGPAAEVTATYRTMFSWIKENGYRQNPSALTIERYDRSRDNASKEYLQYDIYLPLQKKD